MKKNSGSIITRLFFLVTVMFITVPLASAEAGLPIKLGSEELGTKIGLVDLDNTPASLKIPDGLKYIGANDALFYLRKFHNRDVEVEGQVGILVNDTISDASYIENMFIITYGETGHIVDYKAENMDFEKVLKSIQEDYPYVEYAWSPSYDKTNKVLSLPFKLEEYLYNGVNDTIISGKLSFLGNKGNLTMHIIGKEKDTSWLENNANLLKNAVTFNPGYQYDDVVYNNGDVFYPSILAYLTGKFKIWEPGMTDPETGAVVGEDYLEKEEEEAFVFPDVPKGWIIGFISLGGLTLLFYVLSLLAPTRHDDLRKRIKKKSRSVALRMCVFMSAYFLLTYTCVFLFYYGIRLLGHLGSVGSVWLYIFTILALIFLAFAVGLLVKSLLMAGRSSKDNPVEITRQEAPELFNIIEKVAAEAGSELPGHVYVSSEPNATVTTENRFINLFVPTRKNLTIGLGLLYYINRSEFKSILAHEFGHFKQRETRSGTIVGIGFSLVDYIYRSNHNMASRSLVNLLKPIFFYVQRENSSLGIDMELEADRIAVSVVGADAAVSALNKLAVISDRFGVYHDLLNKIAGDDKKVPSSYWKGYESYLKKCSSHDGFEISSDKLELKPLLGINKSRVKLENIWMSHPEDEERIANMRAAGRDKKQIDFSRAIELIPSSIFEEVSRTLYAGTDLTDMTTCSDDEYNELVTLKLKLFTFPLHLRPYFFGMIQPFDLNNRKAEEMDPDELFTDSNGLLMREYNQAINDYQTMLAFSRRQIPQKRIRYMDKIYTRHNIPVEMQLDHIKALEKRVEIIQKKICSLAAYKAEDPQTVLGAYDDIFYAQHLRGIISNEMMPERNSVYRYIASKPQNMSPEDLAKVRKTLQLFNEKVKQFICDMDIARLYPVLHKDMNEEICAFVNKDNRFQYYSIGGQEISELLSMPDKLIVQFDNLIFYSKKKITDILCDEKPVMSWSGSVTESY